MKPHWERFRTYEYIVFSAAVIAAGILCVCAGSVNVPLADTAKVIFSAVRSAFIGAAPPTGGTASIIVSVRLPRVICTALVGASLSLGGAAMQGLLKNPLADGSTLGVSSGASLGAVIAIAFGVTLPGLPLAGTAAMAMLFALISLFLILSLAYRLDYSLSTNTIILIGVIYSMFVSSIMSLIITFAPDRLKHITFWTMGSMQGSTYASALLLLTAFVLFGGCLLFKARELNAFAVGEDNARSVGVNVKRVKLTVLICVSALIGASVSISGTIGFVGLVTPHIVRILTGPNHRRLLPASAFSGAVFLLLADLISRTLLSPLELPIGVVTSFAGSIVFMVIFFRARRVR